MVCTPAQKSLSQTPCRIRDSSPTRIQHVYPVLQRWCVDASFVWQISSFHVTPSERTKMNPSLCGIFLCSLLAIFQHSRSMLNQLHQTTCAKISDQLVLMKDCHFVSGNHAFAGHWWCHMGRGKLSIESIAISRFVKISSDFLRDDPTKPTKMGHFWCQPCCFFGPNLGLVPAVGPSCVLASQVKQYVQSQLPQVSRFWMWWMAWETTH